MLANGYAAQCRIIITCAAPTTYTILYYIYKQKVIFFIQEKHTQPYTTSAAEGIVVDEINPLPIHHRHPHS